MFISSVMSAIEFGVHILKLFCQLFSCHGRSLEPKAIMSYKAESAR